MERRAVWSIVLGFLLGAAVLAGRAPRARAEETEPHRLGIGYKIGNGIGFVGGDVIFRIVPHVAVDLQANYFQAATDSGTARGYGLAPTVQLELRPVGHTPYIGAGVVYARMSLQDVTASATGALLNLGYHWRFASGLAILLGGGLGYLGDIRATDGFTTISRDGGPYPNIEAGVRYFF